MKKVLLAIGAVALLMGAVACEKTGPEQGNESSMLMVSWGDQETKGSTTQLASEQAINDLWFYVFDKNGMLEIAHQCTADEINAKKAAILCKVDAAAKTVWAIANVPAAVRTNLNSKAKIADLEAVTISLSDNSLSSFILKGKNTVTVASSGGECTIQLVRPVSKVALRSVKNSLPSPYGQITLKQAFLCNVVGNQNIAGNAAISTWLNREATSDHGAASNVIGSSSSYPSNAPGDHLFLTLGDAIDNGATKSYSIVDANGKYMYGFPNTTAAEPGNPGYTAAFTPTCTVLMIVATILGKDYYYPIPLKLGKFVANTDNIVDVTLIGLGNTIEEGAFNKIEKATLTAKVEIKDWETGSTYTETI